MWGAQQSPGLTLLPQAHLLRPSASAGAGGCPPLLRLAAPSDLCFLLIYTLVHKRFEATVGKDGGDENAVHAVCPFENEKQEGFVTGFKQARTATEMPPVTPLRVVET